MENYLYVHRRKLLREAGGYLDLVMCLDDLFRPDDTHVTHMCSKALALLDRYEELGGRPYRTAFLRGQAYRVMGDYELAISWFWKAMERDSHNAHAYLGLAWCYKRLDELDLAIETLGSAREIDPTNPLVIYNLACYFALAGDVAGCCGCLLRAFDLNEELRNLVADEPDFELVRNHPEFLNLILPVC